MTPRPNEKNINTLAKALELYENGKSIPTILTMFPESANEIRQMFQTIVLIAKEGEKIVPREEGLKKMLQSLPHPIFVPTAEPFDYSKKGQGLLVSDTTYALRSFSWIGWKLAVPIAAIVLAVGGFWVLRPGTTVAPGQTASNQSADSRPTIESTQTSSATKSNAPIDSAIDAAIDSIVTAANLETATIQNDPSGAVILNTNSNTLNTFTDSYVNQI